MKLRKRRKLPVEIVRGVTIRETRPGLWQVDRYFNGKRERKAFTDKTKAVTYAEQVAATVRNEGSSAFELTPRARADAATAVNLLKGRATLEAVARYWVERNPGGESVTVTDLGNRWLVAIRAQGCRPATMVERTHKVNRLAALLGDRPAASVTKDDLLRVLDQYGVTGVTWDGYRRAWRAMFQWALDEKLVPENPAAVLKAVHTDEKLPTPFTVADVTKIMHAAETHAPECVAWLAVQFFGGLRPGEAFGLCWESVDLTERIIRVRPETSKVRRSRNAPITKTLAAWLMAYAKDKGPVGVTTAGGRDYHLFRKKINDKPGGILALTGVKWIQDGPRKTFASAHYAAHGDAATLASALGHTGGNDVLFRHYRGLYTPSEAKRYWEIRPEHGQAVEMKKQRGVA